MNILEKSTKPATMGMLASVVKQMTASVSERLRKSDLRQSSADQLLCDMEKRIEALEAQAASLMERGLLYRGVHQRADEYRKGDVVTCAGSIWIALRATSEEPGTSKDWQLAVKGAR